MGLKKEENHKKSLGKGTIKKSSRNGGIVRWNSDLDHGASIEIVQQSMFDYRRVCLKMGNSDSFNLW